MFEERGLGHVTAHKERYPHLVEILVTNQHASDV